MYKIKERKGAKKFMNDMIEKCKIFFEMSSIDKSCLIDYLNENSNNIVCTIGQCENDIDSIIESNVGINLKNPINKNTILCHFYSSKNDIICAKDIMEIGRLFFENINILEYISFLYSITINSFIFCCFLRETDIPKNELDFLEIELYVLLFSSFISKINKENIYINQKSKIVTIYDAILFAELLIIKITSFYLFAIFFTGDLTFDTETLSKEFISFYFILCSEYILSCILAFNFGSFYKENPLESRIFIILSLFYIAYITLLTFLCSSNMSYDIFNITFFAHSEALIDSYTDKNKAYLILTIIVDIVATIIFCSITKLIFKRYLK
jgi:magnesium-transporting ATPase (P-type)